MEPEWKQVTGYYGKYMVSSDGRVKSIIKGKNIILKPRLSKPGYLYVNLCGKSIDIHRLVAREFLEGFGEVVNHKDLNKTNNHSENLEYISHRENSHHYHNSKGRENCGIEKNWK